MKIKLITVILVALILVILLSLTCLFHQAKRVENQTVKSIIKKTSLNYPPINVPNFPISGSSRIVYFKSSFIPYWKGFIQTVNLFSQNLPQFKEDPYSLIEEFKELNQKLEQQAIRFWNADLVEQKDLKEQLNKIVLQSKNFSKNFKITLAQLEEIKLRQEIQRKRQNQLILIYNSIQNVIENFNRASTANSQLSKSIIQFNQQIEQSHKDLNYLIRLVNNCWVKNRLFHQAILAFENSVKSIQDLIQEQLLQKSELEELKKVTEIGLSLVTVLSNYSNVVKDLLEKENYLLSSKGSSELIQTDQIKNLLNQFEKLKFEAENKSKKFKRQILQIKFKSFKSISAYQFENQLNITNTSFKELIQAINEFHQML